MIKFEGKPAGPDRVVGVGEEGEFFIKGALANRTYKEQVCLDCERDMTADEKAVISEILLLIPSFLAEYGATESRILSPKQIHVLDEEKKSAEYIKDFIAEGAGGRLNVDLGRIDILVTDRNLLSFAHFLVHELVHYNSFYSLHYKSNKNEDEPDDILPRRHGLKMGIKEGEEESVFGGLDEAVTEELTIRFMKKYFPQMNQLKDEFLSKYSANSKDNAFHELTRVSNDHDYVPYAYLSERSNFLFLIKYLHMKNSNKFKSPDEVFKLFSSAMLQGGMLPVARLIEKTFGNGAFRIIGENSAVGSENLLRILSELIRKSGMGAS